MIAETHRVRLALGRDARLLRALGAAIAVLGDAAGLHAAEAENLAVAAEAACEDAFQRLTPEDPRLIITVESFSDRLEVTLSHRGQSAPAIGLETFTSREAPKHATGAAVLQGVDRLQYDSDGGIARTRLVKYLHRASPRP